MIARQTRRNSFAVGFHSTPMARLGDIGVRVATLSKTLGDPPRTAKGAVAMILRGIRGPVEVLLIERAEREGDPWSGQIAFPGGRRARTDRTLLDTARRETKEEVGLSLVRDARLLGWLPWRAPANRVDWIVVPYVFTLRRSAQPKPTPEVARAFWARVDALPATLHKAILEFPDGDLEAPAFDVGGGKPLWGFTFRVLCDFFDLVGWPAAGSPERRASTKPRAAGPGQRGRGYSDTASRSRRPGKGGTRPSTGRALRS